VRHRRVDARQVAAAFRDSHSGDVRSKTFVKADGKIAGRSRAAGFSRPTIMSLIIEMLPNGRDAAMEALSRSALPRALMSVELRNRR
jgi:hypothetical protein